MEVVLLLELRTRAHKSKEDMSLLLASIRPSLFFGQFVNMCAQNKREEARVAQEATAQQRILETRMGAKSLSDRRLEAKFIEGVHLPRVRIPSDAHASVNKYSVALKSILSAHQRTWMTLPGVKQEQYLTNGIFDRYKGDTSELGDFAGISRIVETCAQNPDMKVPVLVAARRIAHEENAFFLG